MPLAELYKGMQVDDKVFDYDVRIVRMLDEREELSRSGKVVGKVFGDSDLSDVSGLSDFSDRG